MTIVLTALFPLHVVQVSDRMLSWISAGKVTRQEDRWNKATVFGDWATIAYTGPARLPDQRTDQWITETISPFTQVDQAINRLREEADRRMQANEWNPPELAIVVAGWMEDGNKVEPFRAAISNYLVPNGKVSAVRSTFDILLSRPEQPGLAIYVAGRNMPRKNVSLMGRTMRRTYRRHASMSTMARILVDGARALKDRFIGDSFNAVILPRPVQGRPVQTLFGAMQGTGHPDVPLGLYFPGGGAGPEFVMPNVGGGGSAFTDISVLPRALTAEEVGERYRAGPPLPT
jgi:hypothetical protein